VERWWTYSEADKGKKCSITMYEGLSPDFLNEQSAGCHLFSAVEIMVSGLGNTMMQLFFHHCGVS